MKRGDADVHSSRGIWRRRPERKWSLLEAVGRDDNVLRYSRGMHEKKEERLMRKKVVGPLILLPPHDRQSGTPEDGMHGSSSSLLGLASLGIRRRSSHPSCCPRLFWTAARNSSLKEWGSLSLSLHFLVSPIISFRSIWWGSRWLELRVEGSQTWPSGWEGCCRWSISIHPVECRRSRTLRSERETKNRMNIVRIGRPEASWYSSCWCWERWWSSWWCWSYNSRKRLLLSIVELEQELVDAGLEMMRRDGIIEWDGMDQLDSAPPVYTSVTCTKSSASSFPLFVMMISPHPLQPSVAGPLFFPRPLKIEIEGCCCYCHHSHPHFRYSPDITTQPDPHDDVITLFTSDKWLPGVFWRPYMRCVRMTCSESLKSFPAFLLIRVRFLRSLNPLWPPIPPSPPTLCNSHFMRGFNTCWSTIYWPCDTFAYDVNRAKCQSRAGRTTASNSLFRSTEEWNEFQPESPDTTHFRAILNRQ